MFTQYHLPDKTFFSLIISPHNDHDIAHYREMHIYSRHEMRAAIKQDLDGGQGSKNASE
jgi:hypothetical protein